MIRCGFELIEAGHCRHPAAMARSGASLCATRFPALVGMIRHPSEGVILFDTGYDPVFFAATQSFPERLYRWTTPVNLAPGEAAVDQLARAGIAPEAVSAIILSHFHGDHVAGLAAFPAARLFCARAGMAELRARGRFARVRRGLLAGLVPEDPPRRTTFFEDLPRVTLPGDFAPFDQGVDLFGDGALIAVELPGHCTGHWGLALASEDGRRLMLVGDAAWSIGAIRDDAPPPRLTTALLGNTGRYRATLNALHRLATRNAEMLLLPSHCPEAARSIGG
ncbi:glyoxylase-like metal-dependent hydrolase (beta-lactamase superfamily II) [Sphingomonas zeicaulis]|uniref:MBL fold metallo-hydrolase n=1 Tax=Sphingomonas zeicaulis TaxID=1632740 RepID=UPI003D1A4749